jgi:hypothetical protein
VRNSHHPSTRLLLSRRCHALRDNTKRMETVHLSKKL